MPLFEKVFIDLKFVELSQKNTCIVNNTNYIGCDFEMCYFACVHGRCYLLECDCWMVEMVKHGKTTCRIAHHVIVLMWMAKLTHLLLLSLPPTIYVLWAILKGNHYVDL